MKRFILIMIFSVLFIISTNAQDTPVWTKDTLHMPGGMDPRNLPDPDSSGARLLAKYCSRCHGIPSPKSHSASDWVPVFRRMILLMEKSDSMGMAGGNMGMMGNGRMGMESALIPSVLEQEKLLSYLQKHSLEPFSGRRKRGAESKKAGLFFQYCSKCHTLPDPSQHTASQWPAVVARMQKHIREDNLKAFSNQDARKISSYLQEHAPGD